MFVYNYFFKEKISYLGQGTLTEKERLSTVDLLNKVACFVKKSIMLAISKGANLN
jgi:hypothetical protein